MITHTTDINSENTAYKILPDFYHKNSYDFKLVERNGDVAIFGQYNEGVLIAYEVFEIRKQKAANFGDIHYEAKERVPGNEEWGSNAYTVYSLEKAEIKMQQILESINLRNRIKTNENY